MSKYPFKPIEFLAKYGTNTNMDEMKNDLDQAISAAVQAERANNDEWFARLVNVWNTGNIGKVNKMLEDRAAANRARNGSKP